jgi:hypothetical protein
MNVAINRVPASAGIAWLKGGFALMRSSPLVVHGAIFCYFLMLFLITLIPVLGGVLSSLLVPALFAGLMTLMRGVAQKQPASFATLLSGLVNPATRLPLLLSGAVYLTGVLISLAVSSIADDGLLFRFMVMGQTFDPKAMQTPEAMMPLFGAMAVSSLAMLPTVAAFWIAPQLIAWQGMGAGKALFFSFFAFFRNLSALLVFFAATIGLLVCIALALSFLTTLFGVPKAGEAAMVPATLFLTVVVYASFYASYESIVQVTPTQDPPTSESV